MGCSGRVRHHLGKFRYCKRCIVDTFCPECSLPPAAVLDVPKCRACDKLALWCGKHVSLEGRQSGLCATHFETSSSCCQFCPVGADANQLAWRSCQNGNCARYVRVCTQRSLHVSNDSLICDMCWRSAGSKCIKCHTQDARTERRYTRCYKKCFSNLDDVTQMILVKAESDAYLQSVAQQQQWTGMEVPLQ